MSNLFFILFSISSNSRVTDAFECTFCGHSLRTRRGMKNHVNCKHATVSLSRNRRHFMVVDVTRKGGRTRRHGIRFFKEALVFCRIQERTSLLEAIPSDKGSNMNFDEQAWVGPKRTKQPPPYGVQESRLPPGGGFTPSFDINEASTASQEGLFSYPSIYAEQTTLSDTTNLERKGTSGPINFYNTPYSSLDNQNYFESIYLSQPYVEPTNSSYLLSLPHDDGFVQQWV